VPVRRLLRLPPDEAELDVRGLGPVGDQVPVLVHSWPRPGVDDALVLMGDAAPADLPDGRARLYVCARCGDPGCGAIGMRVERTPTTVVWSAFKWEVPGDDRDEDGLDVIGGPFTFDRVQHDAELRRFVATYDTERAALPDDAAVNVERGRATAARRTPWWRRGLDA
jgi:hypothetical protein